MPITITQSNYEAVARSHLREGERLEIAEGAMRGVVALTDRRLLVSNFPWSGAATLIFEAPLSGLGALYVEPLGARACRISASVGGFTRQAEKMGMVVVVGCVSSMVLAFFAFGLIAMLAAR